MNIKSFDLNIIKHIEKLINNANKRFPKRTWYIETKFWEDGDFYIEVCSTWGYYKDIFFYKKSENEYKYYRKVLTPKVEELK